MIRNIAMATVPEEIAIAVVAFLKGLMRALVCCASLQNSDESMRETALLALQEIASSSYGSEDTRNEAKVAGLEDHLQSLQVYLQGLKDEERADAEVQLELCAALIGWLVSQA